MSYEDAYNFGVYYGETGLTLTEINEIKEYLIRNFGNIAVNGFINGYKTEINNYVD